MKNKIFAIVLCVVLLFFTACTFKVESNSSSKKDYTSYNCDVNKDYRQLTTININKEDDEFVKVAGDVFKHDEDPLTMYDVDDNRVAYVGDSSISQEKDSHGIYVNDKWIVDMTTYILGEIYEIYDKDENIIASVKFNMSNTQGVMYDAQDNIIAEYTSNFLEKDFKIAIYEQCKIKHEVVLMIFCSYYSGYANYM